MTVYTDVDPARWRAQIERLRALVERSPEAFRSRSRASLYIASAPWPFAPQGAP